MAGLHYTVQTVLQLFAAAISLRLFWSSRLLVLQMQQSLSSIFTGQKFLVRIEQYLKIYFRLSLSDKISP